MTGAKLPQRIRFLGRVLERVASFEAWANANEGGVLLSIQRYPGPAGARVWCASVWIGPSRIEVRGRPSRRAAQDALRRKLRRVRDELAGLEL